MSEFMVLDLAQEQCVIKICKHLDTQSTALVVAPLESKTFIAVEAARRLGAEYIFLLCFDLRNVSYFQRVFSRIVPVEKVYCTTYHNWKFGISNNTQPFTFQNENGDYIATDRWNNLIENHKTFLILDGFYVSNLTYIMKALAPNTRAISLNSKNNSKILLFQLAIDNQLATIHDTAYVLGLESSHLDTELQKIRDKVIEYNPTNEPNIGQLTKRAKFKH